MNSDFSFPHPVLGLNNDIDGEFNVDISIKRDSDTREIIFFFEKLEITNEYFKELLNKGIAGPFVKIYCSSTLKTWTFYDNRDMRIDEDEVINHVEVDVRLLSLVDNFEFYHDTFNNDFENEIFILNKHDTIGILETERVPILKENEKLGLGNIFKFRTHEDSNKPLEFEVQNDEYIEIIYPSYKNEHPHSFMFNRYPWTAYSIFILPALEEAFRFMEDEKRQASQLKWYNILDKLLPETERTKNHFINAQRVLEGEVPLIKSYIEISDN